MKKTRGKKKKVTLFKRIKKFFIFKNKVPVILIIALLALAVLLIFFNNSTGNTITGDATFSINDSPPQIILTISDFLNLGTTWKELIISIIVLVIIFAGLFDMLQLTSIFTNNWVLYVIAGGLSIIACLTTVVRAISTFAIQVASGMGAIGIAIEVIIAVVIFIGLSFGSTRIALWAAKRHAQKAMVQTTKAAGDTAAAISGLRRIETEFKKPK